MGLWILHSMTLPHLVGK